MLKLYKQLQASLLKRIFCAGAAFAVIAIITLPGQSHGLPFELTGEIATGYNTNPERAHQASGSGYAQYSLAADKRFSLAGPLFLKIGAEGNYQEFFRTGNNYFLQTGAEISAPVAGGRWTPALIAAVNAYRNDLLEEDERDGVLTGTRLSWVASSLMNFHFSFLYHWLDYKNRSLPYGGSSQGSAPPMSMSGQTAAPSGTAGGGMMGGGTGGGMRKAGAGLGKGFSGREHAGAMMGGGMIGGGMMGGAGNLIHAIMRAGMQGGGSGGMTEGASETTYEPPRNDHLAVGGIDADLFLTPSLTGKVHAGYAGLHSSVGLESYRQQQFGAGLAWEPLATWLVDVEGAWYRTRFYNSSAKFRRRDNIYAATIRVSKAIGQFEPFVQLGWVKDHSTLKFESYRQTVTQCGIAFSF